MDSIRCDNREFTMSNPLNSINLPPPSLPGSASAHYDHPYPVIPANNAANNNIQQIQPDEDRNYNVLTNLGGGNYESFERGRENVHENRRQHIPIQTQPMSSENCNRTSEFERTVLNELRCIRERLSKIEKAIAIKKSNKSHLFETPDGFPLTTSAEFDAFENAEPAVHDKLQEHLEQLGGQTTREVLNRYIRVVMTNTLAVDYTWSGKSDTDGNLIRALYRSKMMRIFYDALKNTFGNNHGQITLHSFAEDIQQVLRSYKQTAKNAARGNPNRKRNARQAFEKETYN